MNKTMPYAALIVTLAIASLSTGLAATSGGAIWGKKAPIPVAVAETSATVLDGKIYVVGGATRAAPSAPMIWSTTWNLMYDPARDVWRKLASLPRPLSHVGLAALDGKLYVFGGFTTIVHMGAQNVALVYDPKTNAWSSLPNLTRPRGSIAVAAIGHRLHLFGGRGADKVVKLPMPAGAPDLYQASGTVATHEIYDPNSRSWTQGAPIPGPGRDHVGIVVLNGKVHLLGGRTYDIADNLDRHDVYDPKTDRWSVAAPLPGVRSAGGVTVLDGRIIYAGGECKPGGEPGSSNAYDDVFAYDPKTDSWSEVTHLPGGGRHAFGAVTVDHVAYFAGGAQTCGGGASTDMRTLVLP